MIKYFRTFHQLAISNYGRSFGWYIELDGTVLGELIHCEWTDMFWDSYKVIPKDEASKKVLDDLELWNQCRFSYRNKVISKYAKYPFSGSMGQYLSNHIVTMRGLYISTNQINDLLIDIYGSIYDTIKRKRKKVPRS